MFGHLCGTCCNQFVSIGILLDHREWRRSMDKITDQLDTEADDPARHEELVQQCSSMLELLEAHNSKEEPIIYTRADADLPAEARAELQDFLRRGTMPDGWVCERAAG